MMLWYSLICLIFLLCTWNLRNFFIIEYSKNFFQGALCLLIIDFYSQLISIKIYTHVEIKMVIAIIIACTIEYAQKFGYFPPSNIYDILNKQEIKTTFDVYDIVAFILGIFMTYVFTKNLPDEWVGFFYCIKKE